MLTIAVNEAVTMDLSSQASWTIAFAVLLRCSVPLNAGHDGCQMHLWCSSLVVSEAHILRLLSSGGPSMRIHN